MDFLPGSLSENRGNTKRRWVLSASWLPGRTISGLTFDEDDFKIAKLKLAIVKRNFRFLDFYEALSKDPYSLITEFRLPDESRDDYLNRLGVLFAEGGPFFGGRSAEFGFFERFITIAQEYWEIATSEILSLLYPGKDLDNLHPLIAKGLPLLFYSPGVEEFGLASGLKGKLGYRRYKAEISDNVERYERLLKIDLRKNPTQLMHEFKAFLKYEREYLNGGKKYEPIMEEVLGIDGDKNSSGLFDWNVNDVQALLENEKLMIAGKKYEALEKLLVDEGRKKSNRLFDWDIDNSRFRDEAWEQLKIWDLRRKKEIIRERGSGSIFTERRTFGRISNELKLTEDLVKKRFYRAYEVTQGLKYDIEKNRELWIIRKSELENKCGTCEIQDDCNDPCPDVLPFVEQDHVRPTSFKLINPMKL